MDIRSSVNPEYSTRTFNELESAVRSYSRAFPVVFTAARGAVLTDTEGREYIDFLAGAGSLNYGHNHPVLKMALMEYIASDGIAHALDFHTAAKADFLEVLNRAVLEPRGLDHVVQFTGPTGANAVEAALKLARKVTGRSNVVAFTNGFHGCTLGALAATGNEHHRGAAGVELAGVSRLPFDGYLGPDVDTLVLLERMLEDPSSGLDHPAAVLLEIVQGEGGLNVASKSWVQRLATLCRAHDIVLIVDDIQAGCGRTGSFFSFDRFGIKPDIITLSKSLSGYGLPFAVTLVRRDLDVWEPGEHNGTFRGNNHAFVTAATALDYFWTDQTFRREIAEHGTTVTAALDRVVECYGEEVVRRKGYGMMQGLEMATGKLASEVCAAAFRKGLVIETSGPNDEVVKCLAPLTIEPAQLEQGLGILARAVDEVLGKGRGARVLDAA